MLSDKIKAPEVTKKVVGGIGEGVDPQIDADECRK